MRFPLLAILWLCSSLLMAQLPSRPPRNHENVVSTRRIAKATRVERAPRLDGTLDDPLWQRAIPISNFLQREPFEGKEPTERTEVRILYTSQEVYFGLKCFDSNPKGIIATELRRDVSQELDDYFEIVIDPSHHYRNAYVFQINALGTQRDALIMEEQRTELGTGDGDPGWDGVWSSAARIDSDGWSATIGLPFSTLNFRHSRTDAAWGINFKRFIRRKNEEALWSGWQRTYGASRVSHAGELRGFSEINGGRLFIVKPYGLMGFSHFPANTQGTGFAPGPSPLLTGGVDVKVGLRSNLIANLTANTDFADADVDAQTFNLTPYKIFFPEKRQFFLENASVFDFRMGDKDILFFSRQIGIDAITGEEVPVNGGAKVTGSLGRFELGLMDVDTRAAGPNPSANYAIARVKRSLWTGSYVGVMGINKRAGSRSDPFNQTAGADARLVFFKNLVVHGFAAQTRSPLRSSGQSDVGTDFNFQTDWLELIAEHRMIGSHFNPEVGFLERANCRCDFVEGNFKPRPKLRGLRELNFDGFLFHAPDTRHILQTQHWRNTFRAEFNNGSYTDDNILDVFTQRLTTPFNIYKNIFIPVGEYHWTRYQLKYGTARNRKLTASFSDQFGGYYNGHLNEARIHAIYRANQRLSFDLIPQWDRFRLGLVADQNGKPLLDSSNFSVVFGSFQANYSFSRFVTFSGLLQVDTANTQAVSANLRLRWNYRPDSDLYVIYTAGQRFASLAVSNPPQFYENRFAVKFTYSWQRRGRP